MGKLKEIQERHNADDSRFGKAHGLQSHKDRGHLLDRIKELEADVRHYRWHKEHNETLAKNAMEAEDVMKGHLVAAEGRIKELEAERDDAVYCHKTSDENRSILQQQLDAVREFADRLRKKHPIGGNECERNRVGMKLQALLKGDT